MQSTKPLDRRRRLTGRSKVPRLLGAVRDRQVTVLIHPNGVTDPRFQKFALWNGVGQPIGLAI